MKNSECNIFFYNFAYFRLKDFVIFLQNGRKNITLQFKTHIT